ncbi:hypothetical protein LWI28_014696 [Acer negundo]|uniref:Uncharacterized protein n=1 Tax=Acer negundo TaxID=4023 RepID=A0AAD5NWU2_ACENE|nr:hypothetical protein LWI28_014696 [Acer negundo]
MKPDHLQAALDGNVAASPFCYINDPTKSDIFHKVSPSGNSLLQVAASCGHINIIELMKPRFPDLILKKNSDGDTALHVAVRAGDLNTVNKLIECAREIPSSSGTNYYESLLKMKNNGGNTALHEAVSVLVESNKSVYTLVSVAHSLVIKYPGVSYHQNNASKSPLCLAVASDNDELLGYILETLGYILETLSHEDGDSVECPKGKSPVHVAIQRKNWNEEGFCPLHLACENGHVRVVQELLRKWPDPTELIGDNGQSILHVVAKNGKDELVRFLLKQDGIDKLINEMDKDGNTPFHLAPLHHRSMVVASSVERALESRPCKLSWLDNL